MIIGNKVFIRSIEQDDIPEVYKWSNDFELKGLFDFTIDFPSYNELICRFDEENAGQAEINFIIVEKETKKPIGICRLKDIDYINKKCICSLYIGDSESRDKGFGTEAMKLLMKFGFEDLNLNRLGLWVFDFNKRAIKCYKRCGMKVEGIMREGVYRNGKYHDVYFMGILRHEYDEMIKGGNEECLEASM